MNTLHILETAVNAVAPIVLMMAVGYYLKQKGFLSDSFLSIGSKLSFQLLLPSMLFTNVYNIEDLSSIPWDVVLYGIAAMFTLFIIGVLITPMVTQVPERRGPVLQCVFRSNSAIIGISLASLLGGDPAVTVCAILSAFTVPLMNVLSVIALSMYLKEGGSKITIKGLVMKVVKNPLITGIFLAACCLMIRRLEQLLFGRVVFTIKGNLKFVYTAISQIGSVTTPFALMILGGQFNFSSSGKLLKEISAATFCRIVMAPLLVLGTACLLTTYTSLVHCGPTEMPALIAIYGTPVAVSSAVMAGQMGSDEQLAAQLVVFTSLGSIVTMFITVCILMSTGFLAV